MPAHPASPLCAEAAPGQRAALLAAVGRELPWPRRLGLARRWSTRCANSPAATRSPAWRTGASFEIRAGARDRPRRTRGRAGVAAADDRHRPLQARQRHPRPSGRRPCAAGDRGLSARSACVRWITCARASAARSSRSSCPTARRTRPHRRRAHPPQIEQRSIAIDESGVTIAVTISPGGVAPQWAALDCVAAGWRALTSSSTGAKAEAQRPARKQAPEVERPGAPTREPALQHLTAGQPDDHEQA